MVWGQQLTGQDVFNPTRSYYAEHPKNRAGWLARQSRTVNDSLFCGDGFQGRELATIPGFTRKLNL